VLQPGAKIRKKREILGKSRRIEPPPLADCRKSSYIVITGVNAMKTRIVRIGNSQGVRIPKPLLDQTGLQGEVEIKAHENSLIISATRKPREGWEEAFRTMAERGDDRLLDPDVPSLTSWDDTEWEW
jgi:antitoxin MazE